MPPRAHRLLLFVVAAHVAALIAFGIECHPVSVPGGEYDFYAERAELLASGVLANDVFHGWLFPLLIAAVMPVVGDAFATGRIVSAFAAGVVVYALHRWSRARFGGASATWTTALLVVNPVFARLGVQVASDMTAAAFLMLAVWRQQHATTRRGWFVVGLCLGAAAAARSACLPLGAIFGVAAWFAVRTAAPRPSWRLLAFVAGAGCGFAPHLVLTALQFGSPWVNENWRVLASKAADWDMAPLHDPGEGSMLSVLRQHGPELLRRFAVDGWRTWTRATGDWLVGGAAPAAIAVAASVVAFAGVIVDAVRHRRAAALSTVVVCVYSALVAFTYQPIDRSLLPIAPLVLATTTACMLRSLPSARAGHAVLGAWLVLVVTTVPTAAVQFARAHAVGEVAMATRLRAERGPTVTIASTFPCLGLHARVRALRVTAPAGDRDAVAELWRRIETAATAGGADYFVTSSASCWASLSELAAARPSGTEIVWHDADVLAIRLALREVPWLAEATVVPAPGAGHLELRVRTNPTPDLLGVGFTITAPGGEPTLLALERRSEREFAATMPLPLPTAPRRRWRFVPACMLGDGRILEARAIELDLP